MAMKTYKDIYRFPLHKTKYGSHVLDTIGNFVFEFEPRFTDKGDYANGWKDFEKGVLDTINGIQKFAGEKFFHKEGKIFVEGDENPVITIRGWGNLTGIGAHNLPPEEAANIQDTFAEFIVERLNHREA